MLHEGLPSEFWEPELRERELTQKKTIKLHGYPFYDEPIALNGTDAEHLTALFSAKKSFKRYVENKRCSGYHPEYCIDWKAGEAVTQALICLECGEIKLFGPKYELHCDLSNEAEKVVTELLSPYQNNRPITSGPQSRLGRRHRPGLAEPTAQVYNQVVVRRGASHCFGRSTRSFPCRIEAYGVRHL
jgi:hypothetical protein